MRLGTSIALLTCNICGAAPCINPSFCRLCRQADAKADRMRPAAKIEWPRGLLDNGVSLVRASAELNRNRPTPEATIEAVKQPCALAVFARSMRVKTKNDCNAAMPMHELASTAGLKKGLRNEIRELGTRRSVPQG
jgi:hypothetical protein